MPDPRGGVRSPEWAWEVPTFSLDERERRWGRVRELMRAAGIDCIAGLSNTGNRDRNQADVRYLTQLGNNGEEVAVVFPLDARVTAITSLGGRWPADDWVGETRRSNRNWADTLIECLSEAGVARGTIALIGLTGGTYSSVRYPDGFFPVGAYQKLCRAFPQARLVSAAEVMGEARLVKSDEEIAFLRRATVIAEKACEAMIGSSFVGVFEPLVMASMYQAIIAAGGSLPNMFGWTSGPFGNPYHRLEQPRPRHLQSGDYLAVEIEGHWGGYAAQLDQSLTFGDVPPWAAEAYRACVECFWDVVYAMRPGATFGELMLAAQAIFDRHPATGQLTLHGRGLGDDGPLISGNRQGPVRDTPLRAGNVFTIKPTVRYLGSTGVGRVGDTVLVTATGAERLGTRPLEHYWHVD